MLIADDAGPSDRPKSLIDGMYEAAASLLRVADIRNRSALHGLDPFDGVALLSTINAVVRRNYEAAGAGLNKDRSSQNWRWHVPQPQIGHRNTSPEVIIERAVTRAAADLRRTDWSNQIPVASGLVEGAGDRRRAIDLVRRLGERHFQLIELKIASDTPLYAAVELAGYVCLWLVARQDRPARPSALLDADTIDLRVLAPRAYYTRYDLRPVELAMDAGARALAAASGVTMTFRYNVLQEAITADAIPAPDRLLEMMDGSEPLHRV